MLASIAPFTDDCPWTQVAQIQGRPAVFCSKGMAAGS
jgi:hypothetical protein